MNTMSFFSYSFMGLHWILFQSSGVKKIILADTARMLPEKQKDSLYWQDVSYVLLTFPEFRNLFYYRLERSPSFKLSKLLWLAKIFLPPIDTLFLNTSDIGSGLFIQHGFATIVAAKKIGKQCQISQQVTIGYSDKIHCPTIGNYVNIYAGAKIIGDVTIGNYVNIGANAVVIKNVPSYSTAVGVPARIIRRSKKK